MKRGVLTLPFTRHFWNFSSFFFLVCILLVLGFILWLEKECGLISYMWEVINGPTGK